MARRHTLTISIDDPQDATDRAFRDHTLDTAGDTALGQTWTVYECVSPACGCGCRRYLPAPPGGPALNTHHDGRGSS